MRNFSETASLGIFYGYQVIQLIAIVAGVTGLTVLLLAL